MANVKVKSEYKELVNMFSELTGSKSLFTVFNDCVECYAIALQNAFSTSRYEKLEKRYRDIISQYTQDEVNQICNIFVKLTDMTMKNPFRDLLGDLYMQLDMGSDALGQFFTPYDVSYLMAACTFDKELCQKEISEKGYVSVNEPTVGGGANIIAFCEVLMKNGINYQTQCIIQCQDLSRLAALMCYVVLSLLGCCAVIKIGDTLSDPYTNYNNEIKKGSEIWTTPMFHIHNCYNKI